MEIRTRLKKEAGYLFDDTKSPFKYVTSYLAQTVFHVFPNSLSPSTAQVGSF